MANVIVPNKPPKDIIKIDGVCYWLKGSTQEPPTHTNDDIDALYDDCEECDADDLSSESSPDLSNSSDSSSSISITLPPEVLSESSSSEGLSSLSSEGQSSSSSLSSEGFSSSSSSSSEGQSSSSSFEISSGNPCYQMCIESDWSGADINGTYTYDQATNTWKQDGGDGVLGFGLGVLDEWQITHPASASLEDTVYIAEIPEDPCPPLNGWTFEPLAGGTQTFINIFEGNCDAIQSSDSSSGGISSSSSSEGFSSSSSSSSSSGPPDNSSSSSSEGFSSSSSSSSSSQSAAAVNECDGVTCPTVNGFVDPPSMQLTVSNPSYLDASGNISWCGKVWTPQEVRDGITKCACPPNYDNQKGGPTTSQYAYNRWSYNASQYNRLRLLRRVNVNSFQDYGLNQMALGVAGYGSGFFGDFVTFQTQVTGFSNIQLGFLTAPTPAAPTLNDYQFTAEFFGSYTHANGITYSWEKGINWP